MTWKPFVLVGVLVIVALAVLRQCQGPRAAEFESDFLAVDFPEGTALVEKYFGAPKSLAWGPILSYADSTESNAFGLPLSKRTGTVLYREATDGNRTFAVRCTYGQAKRLQVDVHDGSSHFNESPEAVALSLTRSKSIAAEFAKEKSSSSVKFDGHWFLRYSTTVSGRSVTYIECAR